MSKLNLKTHWWIGAVLAYAIALVFNAIGFSVWLPSCPIYAISGIECFGCGINRSAIQLLRGNIIEAYKINPLLFLYILLTTIWITFRLRNIINHLNQKSHE